MPPIPPTTDQIPPALCSDAQWVCWQIEQRTADDKPTKVPINPATGGYASVTEPDTWTDLPRAYAAYRVDDRLAGIGYVFTATDPYVGVDMDDCRDPATGKLTERAHEVIQRLGSYTETSPSGTGVHVIVQGDAPPGRRRNGDIELYDRDRYFTVTGRRLTLTPDTVNERTSTVAVVHEDYLATSQTDDEDMAETAVARELAAGDDPPDDELIEAAMHAGNSDKFERLWRGDTSGYPSHSEADQALCNLLAFWTGGDPQRVERLFSQSALAREKWRQRADYRNRTIKRAIQDCSAFYDPSESELP